MRLAWLKEVPFTLMGWLIFRLSSIWNFQEQLKVKIYSNYPALPYLEEVNVGEPLFPFCLKTKQATRYWQEAQPRLPQQIHSRDICWRGCKQSVESAGCQSHPNFPALIFCYLCRKACAAFRLILVNIASWRLTTHILIKFWPTNNMKIVLAIPVWLLVSLHVSW